MPEYNPPLDMRALGDADLVRGDSSEPAEHKEARLDAARRFEALLAKEQAREQQIRAEARAEALRSLRCDTCRHYMPPAEPIDGHCRNGALDGWLVKPDFGCVLWQPAAPPAEPKGETTP